jgi:hypothetical protein
VRRCLENQRDQLLAFAQVLDEQLEEIAQSLQVPRDVVRWIYELEGIVRNKGRPSQGKASLREFLSPAFHPVHEAVVDVLATTVL